MITDIADVTLASKQSTAEQQCHDRNLCKNGFQSSFYTKIQHHIIRKFAFFFSVKHIKVQDKKFKKHTKVQDKKFKKHIKVEDKTF
jgi:hypothetical protein